MDDRRFDDITRVLAGSATRRGFLKAALGAVLAALGVEPAWAAARCTECTSPCQRCVRGVCVNRTEGTRCLGRCGVCEAGVCTRNASACGNCQYCETLDMSCRPNPGMEGDTCGNCGICHSGTCESNPDACVPECETCRRSAAGFSCKSRCGPGKRCCADGSCVPVADCCPGQHRCSDDTCCYEECCGSTCCDPRTKQCCGGECCDNTDVCIDGRVCCHEGAICPIPGTSEVNCCNGQVCCPETGRCATSPDECCRDCSPCEKCNTDDGTCTPDPAKDRQHCDNGTPCGGICDSGVCKPVAQGERCADGNACCAEGCCASSTQSCCAGHCCNSGQCCGGECCVGTCIPGFDYCCPIDFFAASVTDSFSLAAVPVCCPYGPPCGEHCCGEGEHCCGDHCCAAGAACCGSGCCEAGKHCCEGVCQTDPCGCPPGQLECAGIGCCETGSFCSREGCCPITTSVICGNPFGDPNAPCCSLDTEHCDSYNPGETPWCCPINQAHYLDGCCPADKPFFTALGCANSGPNGVFCCDDASIGDLCDHFADHCTATPVPGHR